MDKGIIIRGACEHNLKSINTEIPRNKLTVITGISGSGKSSLAFDTLYAEGQRRYVESLSAYARQFLGQMKKPQVESIEGLSPAIAIEQKTSSRNPRSTVGTVTEIYDYLRLLFARAGTVNCYKCGQEISSQTVQQMVERLFLQQQQQMVTILAPLVRGRKGEYQKELKQLLKDGFSKVRIDGETFSLEELPKLNKQKKHQLDVYIDRVIVEEKNRMRLSDSLETSLKLAEGLTRVILADKQEIIFSENFSCSACEIDLPEVEPRLFSFNNPAGACPSCDGLGNKQFFDQNLIVPNQQLSLRERAIVPFANKSSDYYLQLIEALAAHYNFDIYTPFKKLPNKIKDIIWQGSGQEKIRYSYEVSDRKYFYTKPFEGVIPYLQRRYRESTSDWVREDLERFMGIIPCPDCQGARLKKEALAITIGGKNIAQLTNFSVSESLDFFAKLKLAPKQAQIASRILKELTNRLNFLNNVGLNYLTLSRSSASLSGGESQRIRLANQIGSHLVGVLYILDEPSIGLHQRDNEKLLKTLQQLRDLGNTLVVVEHDEQAITAADHIIDMGPGAGIAGGKIIAAGTAAEIKKNKNSLTGRYLRGEEKIPIPKKRRQINERKIVISGAKEHNLKKLDVTFPLGLLVCVTGVSGSGKSTLVIDTLYQALKQRVYQSKVQAGEFKDLTGSELLDKVIDIDQSPIGRTPRSNPATYTGLFAPIREQFAKTKEARLRGYKAGRFSFNVKGGRCEACQGDGSIKIEMHFLPDLYVPCEVCKGKRYNRQTLEVKYKGYNIAEILGKTINQASEIFQNIPAVKDKLKTLRDVGLGYIQLGQSATTLSGGEAQRIKLSRELSKRSSGKTIYILDEPTTGLHFDDIRKLLEVLNRLVDAGNSVLIIEHNLDVIKSADFIIDLGPDGGDNGGYLVASGTPEEVAQNPASHTGYYLKQVLG